MGCLLDAGVGEGGVERVVHGIEAYCAVGCAEDFEGGAFGDGV